MQESIKNSCKKCLLPVLPEAQALGDTSLLFASLHCQCHKQKSGPSSPPKESAAKRCPACGKQKGRSQRAGSFTSYLFKDFRCQCKKSDKVTAASLDIKLQKTLSTQFFSGSLNKTRLARLEQKMLGHTQMVLSRADSNAIEVLEPGEMIAGSYVLEEQVGQGGMGMIYRARHRHFGRLCALKFLLPSAVSAASWEMFKTEAKILNELKHPAICQIYDMGLHKGTLPFYAMEYLDGITLEELLNRKNTLSLGAALETFIAVGGALAYAHRQKIIHKDVKPANIMLVISSNNSISIKLLDFGIAQLADSSANLKPSDIVGSACYMSPEQFACEALSATTDIYSLACALFETLTGTAPFNGKNFQELSFLHQEKEAPSLKEATGQDFPPEIEALLEKALRKESHFRYKYMSEMVIDMERLAEGKELQFARLDSKYITSSSKEEEEEEETSTSSKITNPKVRLGMTLGLGTLAVTSSAYYYYQHIVNDKKPQSPAITAPKQKLQFETTKEDLAQTAEDIGRMPTSIRKSGPLESDAKLHAKLQESMEEEATFVAGADQQTTNQDGPLAILTDLNTAGIKCAVALPQETQKEVDLQYEHQATNILSKLANGDYTASSDLNFPDYVKSTTNQDTYIRKKTPMSRVIKEGGIRWRIFLFPKNDCMGFVHKPDTNPLITAQGVILVPNATPFHLSLNEKYSQKLELYSRFDPQAFCKTSLVNLNKLPDLTVLDTQKALHTLSLSDCVVIKNDFQSISQCKRIKKLILRNSHFRIDDFTDSGVLNTIKELHFKPDANHAKNFKDLFAALGKNANSINTLNLVGEIEPSSLLNLAHSKSLKNLVLSEDSLNDEHLEILAKLNNLDQIKIYYFGNKPLIKFSDKVVTKLKNRMGKRLVLSN